MKKQIILILIILTGLCSCEKVKSSDDVKIEAEAFKQKLIHLKNVGKTFLDLFGVAEQKQLIYLTVGNPIPVVLFDNQKLSEANFKNTIEGQLISYYIIPYIKNSQVVCWAYYSAISGSSSSTPIVITPVDCSILKSGHPMANIGGRSVAVGLKLNIIEVYSDMSEFDIGIYKYNNEFYEISLKNSFKSEQGFQLIEGQSYTLKIIQQILEKNVTDSKF